jgi:hypothetical protein
VASLSEELQTAHARAATLTLSCQQLEEGRREDLALQKKLRSDLKALQLSVAAAYKDQARADEDAGSRLSEAHSEAKARQLQNQLEFLKSQLASEQQSSLERQSVIESLERGADGLREEARILAQESDRLVSAAVEDTERRVEARFLDQLQDLSSLRARVGLLQTQLQDAQVRVNEHLSSSGWDAFSMLVRSR